MNKIELELDTLSAEQRELLELWLGEEGLDPSSLPIVPQKEGRDSFPLSFAQQRLWFLHQLEPGSVAYNVDYALRIRGPLNTPSLEQSLSELVRRHESLRTVFVVPDEDPVQVIREAVPVRLEIVELSGITEAGEEAIITGLAAEEARRPFDLASGQLLRLTLLRLDEQDHMMLITMHHIVSDAWSIGVFTRELSILYNAFSAGRPSPLEELPIQYADFAVWQRQHLRGENLDSQLEYWKRQLAGYPPMLNLRTDRPRPPINRYRGANHAIKLSRSLSERITHFSRMEEVTLFMTLVAAYSLLLYRCSGQPDIVLGTPIANRNRKELEGLIGFFANTLVIRTDLGGESGFRELVRRVKTVIVEAFAHQDLPFEQLVDELQPERDLSRNPLFQVWFALQTTKDRGLYLPGLTLSPLAVEDKTAKFDLSLSMIETEEGLWGEFNYNIDLFDAETIHRMAGVFEKILEEAVATPDRSISQLRLLSPEQEREITLQWNETTAEYETHTTVHELFETMVARQPDAVAVGFGTRLITFDELNRRANKVAHYLISKGVVPEMTVGICVERSLEMMVGLLGILKAGAAYVPLDYTYPRQRLNYIATDARLSLLLTSKRLRDRSPDQVISVIYIDADWETIAAEREENPNTPLTAENIAYVIYTSGSTGQPKGVMINHRNVVNFFAGMDQRVGCNSDDTLLAVTSISFDISVLELLWTLTQGARVTILPEYALSGAGTEAVQQKRLEFSLLYFASDDSDSFENKYRLLIEGARFADEHGFTAIWTPERHFHAFGGLFPNPSVTSAALATITKQIRIRAGSVVLPLHSPIRIAEEWSLVDNLSNGRVDIAFASGWHADDFVFSPDSYSNRRDLTIAGIDTVQRLWRGESVLVRGGAGNEIPIKIFPRPVQSELPVWITAAGTTETFIKAGELGANVLTHLLGQSIEEVADRIRIYRDSLARHGFDPKRGCVTLMLHTFLGESREEVREKVHQPFINYLRSSTSLLLNLINSLNLQFDPKDMSDQDMDSLLEFAFNRYFETSALFGTTETCEPMIEQLKSIGVDEVACLIDFGVDVDSTLAALPYLHQLKEVSNSPAIIPDDELLDHVAGLQPSLMQCTPSTMKMLLLNEEAMHSLESLQTLLLGGEPLPVSLAREIEERLPCRIMNMYGPTETTIWSSSSEVEEASRGIGIGKPIANTQIYVVDRHFQPLPIGVPGELAISGDGLARGYLDRPELTAERFTPNPFQAGTGARLYQTGDLAAYPSDGNIQFLGRVDNQVKVRGFRVELGEIEVVLGQHPAVREAVVIAPYDEGGDKRLVAYLVYHSGHDPAISELRGFLEERLPGYLVPSTIVRLDALPLTSNGKINRRALPAPESLEVRAERPVALARDNLEIQLAKIWAEILEIKGNIGITDNFFELGGHSIRAIRLMAQIVKWFGQKLPLSTLFQGATIEHLASVLRGQASVTRPSPLVSIQPQGSKPAFFCIHTGSGEVLSYEPWARYLGREQPFYGLQDHMAYREEDAVMTLEEIGAQYIDAIRTVQPEGPYLLGGWSFGGLVAFEMAQQLIKKGQSIGLLVLVDAPSPAFAEKTEATDDATLLAIITNQLTRSTLKGQQIRQLVEDLRLLGSDEQFRHVLSYFVDRQEADKLDPEYAIEFLRRQLRIFRSRIQVTHAYEALYYPGRITLLRPSEEPDEFKRLDQTKGWGELSGEPVEIHYLPGNHQTIGLEPNVQALAECLRVCIERSQTSSAAV